MGYTYKELKKVAVDFAEGKIFTSMNISENNMGSLLTVFMPLALMTQKQKQELISEDTFIIYEYLDQAGPMCVNGMPTFFSFRMMNKKDFYDMWIEYEKYVEMRKQFLEEYEPALPMDFLTKVMTEEDIERCKLENTDRDD